MIGAIAGDIIGSVYEHRPIKAKDFPLFDPRCRFTDDTVLTVAIADAILSGRSYLESVRAIGRRYPRAGYGGTFVAWLHSHDPRPYNSWGNVSCQGTVPEAIIALLDSSSFEDGVRNAVSLGGDSDTLDCITGGIAEAFYGAVPESIHEVVQQCLNPDLWEVTEAFCKKYR